MSATAGVVHWVQGLGVGGMERAALQLAARGRTAGFDDRLAVYDRDPRAEGGLDPRGVPVDFVPRRRGLDPTLARRLRRSLEACGAGVVHAHNDTALVYAALALRGMRRRPRLVATFHNAPARPTLGARLAARWASRRAQSVVAVSAELAARLRRDGWLETCGSIPNGVDPAAFAPAGPVLGLRARLGFPDGALVVGHVGRFDANKRQADLVAAIRLVRAREPLARCVFAGDGPERAAVERAAGGDPAIRFAGSIGDVAAFLREIDVFALTSADEGMPMALLEAMACARPIVATRAGGVPEALGDGEPCAELVPAGDARVLAGAIASLLASPARRAALGARARARAEGALSFERTWSAYAPLYGRA